MLLINLADEVMAVIAKTSFPSPRIALSWVEQEFHVARAHLTDMRF